MSIRCKPSGSDLSCDGYPLSRVAHPGYGADVGGGVLCSLCHQEVLRGLILGVDVPAYQRRLIGALEWVAAVKYPELLKWFPVLLKQAYDADLLDEEICLEWAEEEEPRTEFTRPDVSDEQVRGEQSGDGWAVFHGACVSGRLCLCFPGPGVVKLWIALGGDQGPGCHPTRHDAVCLSMA
jgi:hypothetical protein